MKVRSIVLASILCAGVQVAAFAQMALWGSYDKYVSYTIAGASATYNFGFNASGSGDSWVIGIGTGNSGNSMSRYAKDASNNRIYYHIYTHSGSTVELTDQGYGQGTVLSGTIAAGVWSGESSLFVSVDSGQVSPVGEYSDTLQINLYAGVPGTAVLVSSATLSVNIGNNSSVLEVRLTPVGSTFSAGSATSTINFGPLNPGLERQIDLATKANTSYKVVVTASNGGQLVKAGNSQWDSSPKVPYTIDFDASTGIQLSTPHESATFTAIAGGLRSHRIKVTIGSFDPLLFAIGTYSDTLIFTIQAAY